MKTILTTIACTLACISCGCGDSSASKLEREQATLKNCDAVIVIECHSVKSNRPLKWTSSDLTGSQGSLERTPGVEIPWIEVEWGATSEEVRIGGPDFAPKDAGHFFGVRVTTRKLDSEEIIDSVFATGLYRGKRMTLIEGDEYRVEVMPPLDAREIFRWRE